MKTLILGAHGQVGHELKKLFPEAVAWSRAECDLSQLDALRSAVMDLRPQLILNAAAYTAVDKAEVDAVTARKINAEAPRVLGECARHLDAIMVHYSTDYVFDGRLSLDSAYSEVHNVNPQSVYGQTKRDGEVALLRLMHRRAEDPDPHTLRALILRTSWVFGSHGNNFLKTMLRLASERDQLRVVADQHGTPTSARLIAHITQGMIRAMGAAHDEDPRWGIYHLTASGHTHWCDYARQVLKTAADLGAELKVQANQVQGITSAEYPAPAPRPSNSRLSTVKLQGTFGVHLPPWESEVNEVVKAVLAAGALK